MMDLHNINQSKCGAPNSPQLMARDVSEQWSKAEGYINVFNQAAAFF